MEFTASLDQLHQILSWIKTQLEPLHLDPKTLYHIELASEEALANIIHHAYRDAPGKLKVQVHLCSSIEIIFIDNGPPFNPLDAKPVDPTLSLDERDIGGLGIHFMRNCVDEIRYHRTDSQNVLTFLIHSSRTK